MNRFRRRRLMLRVGIAAPMVAFAATALAMLLFPGFDNATQYLSELGGPHSPAPLVFNGGVALAAIATPAAGVGFCLAILALGGGRVPAVLIALAFILGATGLVIASLFPWPSPIHRAVNLGLGIQMGPIFLLWGLARAEGVTRLRWFLAATLVAMLALTVITKHLVFKGTVNDGNVGWWERGFALVLVGWIAVAAFALEQRLLLLARAEETAVPTEP